MKRGFRRVIAEQIASTVRVLELLGFEYEVRKPRNERAGGNKSPRVVHVKVGGERGVIRVYNNASGNTWANLQDGTPIAAVRSVEDLYTYLKTTS